MKKIFFSLTLFVVLLFMENPTFARGIIIYSDGEKIERVKKLPDDATINDEHVNLGVMYKQFSIFWIPMWNYGETKYVLINDKKNTYYDLDEEDIELIRTEFNVKIPNKPTIGFWNKIGGKIIWTGFILLGLYGWWSTRKENEEAKIPDEDEEDNEAEGEEAAEEESQ